MVPSIHGSDIFAKQILRHVLGEFLLVAGTSQVALVVKNPSANVGDMRDAGLIPGSGRSPGGGHGNPLQYSCLENHPGQRTLVGYSPWGQKSWTQLSD